MTSVGLKHTVASSLRWAVAAKFAGQLVSWAITIFVVRLLMPSDYGLLAIANVFIGLISMIAEMGFGASIVQATTLSDERLRRIYGAALSANAAIFVALAVAAWPIARFYAEPRLAAVIQVSAISLLLGTLCLAPDALLRRSLGFKWLSIIDVGSALAGNCVTLALAYLGHGVWSLVAGGLVNGSIRFVLLQLTTPQRVWPSFRIRGIRDMVSFGAHVTTIRVLWYVFLQADVIIAGKLLGQHVLGLYSVAVHLATLPMQRLSTVVNDVAFPAFSRIQNDKRAVSANLRLAVRLVSLIAFPLLWGLASVAPELVRVALGDNWTASIIPMQIVAVMIPLRMINSLIATIFISTGFAKLSTVIAMLTTLLAIVFYFVGAHYGIIGLSCAWVAITPISTYVTLRQALPRLGVSWPELFGEISRPALAAILMVTGLYAIRSMHLQLGELSRLAILLPAGALLYGLATLMINRDCAHEALDLLLPAWRQWMKLLALNRTRS